MSSGTIDRQGARLPPGAHPVATPDAPVLFSMGNELKARLKQLELDHAAASEQNAALSKELTQLKGDFSVLSGKFDALTKVVNDSLSKPAPIAEHPFPRVHQPKIAPKRKFEETSDRSSKEEALSTVDELLKRGEMLRNEGKYDDAYNDYKKAFKLDKNNIEVKYGIAACYLGQDNYEKATAWLNHILNEDKSHLRARLALADCYSHQKKFAEAQVCIETACKENPTRSNPWIRLGNLMKLQGNLEKALEAYQEGLRRNKNNPDCYVRMAECLIAKNNLEEAKALLEKGLVENPNDNTLKAKLSGLSNRLVIPIKKS